MVQSQIEAIPYSTDQLNNNDPTSFVYEIKRCGKTIS